MTVTDTTRPAETTAALQRPVYGAAHFTPDGRLTVGTHADGSLARWRIARRGRTEHTTIVGATAAGISSLLRSVLHAAHTTGTAVQAIDLHGGLLAAAGHPSAASVAAARTVLDEEHELAYTRLYQPAGERGLRLLVIDDLDELARDRRFVQALDQLVKVAGKAGIAVLAGTHDVSLPGFGGNHLDASLIRETLTQHLVTLRLPERSPARPLWTVGVDPDRFPPIPDKFRDGSSTAGIGYRPRQTSVPFRAWLP